MNTSYPFPRRNLNYENNDCFFVNSKTKKLSVLERQYERKISTFATNIKHQYLSIESLLVESFQFVNPEVKNLKTNSVKFATIIRESSNLYEQLSRVIYNKVFANTKSINIYNYLSLSKFLKFHEVNFHCPTLKDIEQNSPLTLKPFVELNKWDKNSKIETKHIPGWWTAYNKIKHSPNEMTNFANLQNVISSTTAAYIIISKQFGPGVLSGDLYKPSKGTKTNNVKIEKINVVQSQLYIDTENLLAFEY
ncbi:hypothetical protein [Lacinutrix chionoecetis]